MTISRPTWTGSLQAATQAQRLLIVWAIAEDARWRRGSIGTSRQASPRSRLADSNLSQTRFRSPSIITGRCLFLRVCIIPRAGRNSLTNASPHGSCVTDGPSAHRRIVCHLLPGKLLWPVVLCPQLIDAWYPQCTESFNRSGIYPLQSAQCALIDEFAQFYALPMGKTFQIYR